MGRIHRYGQEKDCLIFNFVATNTREGRVLQKLFERLQAIEDDLDPQRTGKVFNVLGDVFPANQLERMVREMYARNLTEEVIKDRIVEEVDAERFRQHHRLDAGGAGQAGAEPLGHRRQVGRGQGAPPGARGHRGLLRRRPAPLAGRPPQARPARTSHVYRIGRVPRTLVADRRAAGAALRQAGPRVQADRLRQGAAGRRPHAGVGHARPSAVRGRARGRAGPRPGRPAARRGLLRPAPRRSRPGSTSSRPRSRTAAATCCTAGSSSSRPPLDGALVDPAADHLPGPAARRPQGTEPPDRSTACRAQRQVEQALVEPGAAAVPGRSAGAARRRRPTRSSATSRSA